MNNDPECSKWSTEKCQFSNLIIFFWENQCGPPANFQSWSSTFHRINFFEPHYIRECKNNRCLFHTVIAIFEWWTCMLKSKDWKQPIHFSFKLDHPFLNKSTFLGPPYCTECRNNLCVFRTVIAISVSDDPACSKTKTETCQFSNLIIFFWLWGDELNWSTFSRYDLNLFYHDWGWKIPWPNCLGQNFLKGQLSHLNTL